MKRIMIQIYKDKLYETYKQLMRTELEHARTVTREEIMPAGVSAEGSRTCHLPEMTMDEIMQAGRAILTEIERADAAILTGLHRAFPEPEEIRAIADMKSIVENSLGKLQEFRESDTVRTACRFDVRCRQVRYHYPVHVATEPMAGHYTLEEFIRTMEKPELVKQADMAMDEVDFVPKYDLHKSFSAQN